LDGALQTARRDFARAMHEVMALQQAASAKSEAPQPRAANAA
jgi:hypothetical protein